jgi:predicted aminopeptidase
VKRAGALLVLLALALGQSACSTLGYYVQSARGQLGLVMAREPIDEVLHDPDAPATLKHKLETVNRVRAFAVDELGLPDSGSYRTYVDLKRPYVVWTVVATRELSLSPKQWCFPIAGCVSYRGYYHRDDAEAFARELRRSGYDVAVNGVVAYSTLGWFDDPVPSTILKLPDYDLAAVIFHELAHEELYVSGDSAFNEAFAVTVQREGVERWLHTRGSPEARARFALSVKREQAFLELVSDTRARLEAVYASQWDATEKRRLKAVILAALRTRYQTLRAGWERGPNYDDWFAGELNNAKLASVATYQRLVPAFQHLLAEEDGDLPRFYRACTSIGHLPAVERARRLEALAAGTRVPKVAGAAEVTGPNR